MSEGSFSKGVGEWAGSAEVYDAEGRFAGTGRDTRTVTADDHAGRVTVEVSFEGPFNLSGGYTIADHGSHRTYEGPLNVGYAEALGDGTGGGPQLLARPGAVAAVLHDGAARRRPPALAGVAQPG